MEGLLENVRQLSRDLRLQMMIIDNFIPAEYQASALALCEYQAIDCNVLVVPTFCVLL